MFRYVSKLLLEFTRHSRMKKLRELNRNQFLSKDQLVELQEEKFRELIKHAKTHVPYYRDILKDAKVESLDDIKNIPFLTKEIIQQSGDCMTAEGYPSGRLISNTTGGSTGEKLEFYNDKSAHHAALILRGNMWTGWEIGEKQTQIWGAHSDIATSKISYRYFKRSLIHRNLMLSSYNMTTRDVLEYHRLVNDYRPQLVTGYSSALYLFSETIRRNNLKMHSPKGVISSAETLQKGQRETIESVFQCKVLDRYGCREVGVIAHECNEQHGLHINIDHVIMEIVNESGEQCRAGETGEIVITDLDNFVFPFIRYRIGDIGVISDRICRCGRGLPLMEKVEGRVWDIIVGANGNRLVGTFWLVDGVVGIRQYQVMQPGYGKLILKLVVDDRFNDDERQKLGRRVKENCGENMELTIEFHEDIPPTESGKHRFIISNVSPFLDR